MPITTRGQISAITDELGRTTYYAYDDRGNKVRTVEPDGAVVLHEWDANNNCVAVVNQIGEITRYEYDSSGRLLQTVLPDGSRSAVAYDATGNVQSVASAETTLKFTYDALNRAISVDGVQCDYDAKGRISSVAIADGTAIRYTYDALDNITELDADGYVLRFTYDVMSRLTRITYPNGSSRETEYDLAGRVLRQTDSEGREETYEYDAVGNVVRHRWPGGWECFTYDAANRLTTHLENGTQETYTYAAGSNLLVRVVGSDGYVITFEYDAAGNILATHYQEKSVDSGTFLGGGREGYSAPMQRQSLLNRGSSFGRMASTRRPGKTNTAASSGTSDHLDAAYNQSIANRTKGKTNPTASSGTSDHLDQAYNQRASRIRQAEARATAGQSDKNASTVSSAPAVETRILSVEACITEWGGKLLSGYAGIMEALLKESEFYVQMIPGAQLPMTAVKLLIDELAKVAPDTEIYEKSKQVATDAAKIVKLLGSTYLAASSITSLPDAVSRFSGGTFILSTGKTFSMGGAISISTEALAAFAEKLGASVAIAIESVAGGGSGGGSTKAQLKKIGDNKRANDVAQEHGYADAEDFKEDFVGRDNIKKFNIKYDPKTNEIILEAIQGGKQVPTGLFLTE